MPSIQQAIEACLSHLLKEPTHLHGCGRTDRGVHASQFFAHFDTSDAIPDDFVYFMNRFLSEDIRIFNLMAVHPKAHAQYDAIERTYTYYIHGNENPFTHDLSSYYELQDFNYEEMKKAVKFIPQISDFYSVCLQPEKYKTTLCKIFDSNIIAETDKVTIAITADRFLRGMVRLLVGRVIEVATGRLNVQDFENTIRDKGKFTHNWKAYPQGLHLTEVTYPYL